jgi:hypothetical protein
VNSGSSRTTAVSDAQAGADVSDSLQVQVSASSTQRAGMLADPGIDEAPSQRLPPAPILEYVCEA